MSLHVALFVTLFLSFQLAAVSGKDCEPVDAVFAIDQTTNVKDEDRQRMLQMATYLSTHLAKGSHSDLYLTGVTSKYLHSTTDGVLNISADHSNPPGIRSNKITEAAVNTALISSYRDSVIRTKAEIVFLLVGETTPVDVPSEMLKKKTIVIIYGRSVPVGLRNIGTTNQHVFLVQNDDDFGKVSERIGQQTCSDSQFVCDVDMYKENRKYSSCSSCFYVCATRQIEDGACKPCPYMRSRPHPMKAMNTPDTNEDVPKMYTKDMKSSFLTAVITSIGTGVIMCTLLLFVYTCYVKKLACFSSSQRSRRNVLLEQVVDARIPPFDQSIELNESAVNLLRVESGPDNAELRSVDDHQEYINIRHQHIGCGIQETQL